LIIEQEKRKIQYIRYLIRISKGKRKFLEEYSIKNPGPGQYNPSQIIMKNPPAYHMISRRTVMKNNNIPGPEKYYPETKKIFKSISRSFKLISYSFGIKYNKYMRSNNDSPGPGNYDVKDPNLDHKKIPFSSQLREIISVKKNNNPGPGSYDSNCSVKVLRDCKSFK